MWLASIVLILDFLGLSCRVRSRHATDRQTDRQTDTGHHFIMTPCGGRGIIMAYQLYTLAPLYCTRCLQKGVRDRPQLSAISTDNYTHNISHFGAISFKGFGPEATTNAPVSDRAVSESTVLSWWLHVTKGLGTLPAPCDTRFKARCIEICLLTYLLTYLSATHNNVLPTDELVAGYVMSI